MDTEPTVVKTQADAGLDAAQRFLRTDVRYALRGGFWLSFGTAAGTLLSFLTAIAFANLLPKAEYGTYKYVLSLAGMLGAFTLTGLGESLSRAAAQGYGGSLRYAFRRALQWDSLSAAAAAAGGIWYLTHGNQTLGVSLFIVAAYLPLSGAAGLYAADLSGRKDFRRATAFALLRSVLLAVSLIVTLFLTDSVIALVAVYLGVHTGIALFGYALTIRGRPRDAAVAPATFRYGAHLSLANFLGALVSSFDKVLIFQVLGPVQTAVFAFAQALPEQLDAFVGHVRGLALPKFAGRSAAHALGPLLRKSLIFFLALIPVVAAYIILAPTLFRIFFPQYMDAVPITRIISLTILVIGPGQLLLAFQTAHKDVSGRYMHLLPTIPWLVLMLLLVKPYGLIGVALAKVVAKTFGTILAVILCIRIARRAEAAERASPPA